MILPKSQEVPTPPVDVGGKDEGGASLGLCSPLAVRLLGPPPHGHAWAPPALPSAVGHVAPLPNLTRIDLCVKIIIID